MGAPTCCGIPRRSGAPAVLSGQARRRAVTLERKPAATAEACCLSTSFRSQRHLQRHFRRTRRTRTARPSWARSSRVITRQHSRLLPPCEQLLRRQPVPAPPRSAGQALGDNPGPLVHAPRPCRPAPKISSRRTDSDMAVSSCPTDVQLHWLRAAEQGALRLRQNVRLKYRLRLLGLRTRNGADDDAERHLYLIRTHF